MAATLQLAIAVAATVQSVTAVAPTLQRAMWHLPPGTSILPKQVAIAPTLQRAMWHLLCSAQTAPTLQFVMYMSSSPVVAEWEGLPPAVLAAASAGEFLTGL